MLTTATAVSESAYHVYMVMANEVARHILQELGILEMLDNRIYINSNIYNPSKSSDQNKNAILVEDKFVCTYDMKHPATGLTYDTTDIGMHMDAVRHRRDWRTRYPILRVAQHNITMYDSLIPFNITLNCELHFRDYIRAHDIADRFLLRFNRGELISLPNLSYNYPIPYQIMQTLWALASTVGVEKECFKHWLEEYSNHQIKTLVSTAAKNKRYEWVIDRRVFETLCKIEYDFGEPDKTGMDNAEAHTLRFTVTLHSSRPSVIYVDYPIIINNTLVPGDIVNVDTSYQKGLYEFLENPNRFLDPVYQYQKFLTYQPVRNPWYDDWLPSVYYSQYKAFGSIPIFIGALTLDEVDCKDCPCDSESKYAGYTKTCGPNCRCDAGCSCNCHHHSDPYDEVDPYADPYADPYQDPYEDPYADPYADLSRLPNCHECPYHKAQYDILNPRQRPEPNPYEEPCPCYCWKHATTNIDITKDLDMYRLKPRLLNYFKDRKETALFTESVYHISVFQDDRQVNPELLEFDGTTLKIPNRLGSNHIYRLVIGYTPPRKVDQSAAWRQGYDPDNPNHIEVYSHPFFFFLDFLIIAEREGVTKDANGQKQGVVTTPSTQHGKTML